MKDKNFGAICLCAMRYALGRETYMPSIVQRYIRAHVEEIETGMLDIMIRDLDEADRVTEHKLPSGATLTIDGYGDSKIDRPGWERFRDWLKERRKERGQ